MVDVVGGGALALGLITAANAALPRIQRVAEAIAPKHAQSRAAAAATPQAAQPAAALIAFQAPRPGYAIISPFGLRRLPWESGGRLHAGVDIAAPAGLPVLAAADGVVTRVATDGGYGRFVELKHATGLVTVYAHLGRFLPQIVPGTAVKAGAPVGVLGSTGSSTGAHLHFEIRDTAGRPLNPELFLGRRFAEARDLPIGEAARIPRGVRVAYVSNIPPSRRSEMEARLADAFNEDFSLVARMPQATRVAYVSRAPKAKREELEAKFAAQFTSQMAAADPSLRDTVEATRPSADAYPAPRAIGVVNGRPYGRFQVQN